MFAHFDARGEVADYVVYYVSELRRHVEQFVFVTTAELRPSARALLEEMGLPVVQRANTGYDFGSYKTGIAQLDLASVDELILCNDSVFGPLYPMAELFSAIEAQRDPDLLGLTSSVEHQYHLQSYFLVFRRRILESGHFEQYWDELRLHDSKRLVIEEQEVGLTDFFLSNGYRAASAYDVERGDTLKRVARSLPNYLARVRRHWLRRDFWLTALKALAGRRRIGVNPTHLDWRYLVEELRFPFIKIELLRDNPQKLRNLGTWPEVVRAAGAYPPELIRSHLAAQEETRKRPAEDEPAAPSR